MKYDLFFKNTNSFPSFAATPPANAGVPEPSIIFVFLIKRSYFISRVLLYLDNHHINRLPIRTPK